MISKPELTPPPLGFRTIPCTGIDLSESPFILTIGLVINARLDPERMETTLSKLVEHKFPRAGARLALRNGLYEFQVPERFNSDNRPFIFTVEEHHEIYDRDGRPQIPSVLTGSKPCVIPDPGLESFLQSNACPRTLGEFVKSNNPFLHVHVNVFDDLTFLGFIAPHIAMDLVGAATLLAAWTRLLSGEDIDSIPGMAWDAQPFAPFSSGPVESEVPRGWFNPGHGHAHVQPDDPDLKSVPRFIRVPKVFLAEAKQSIMDELKVQGSAEYVGSGDVLMAWWLKTLHSHRSLTDETPMHIHILRNLRGLPIYANDSPMKDPYINNAILAIPVPPIPVSAFQTESLGALALCLRRSIMAYNTDFAGLRADVHWRCAESNRHEIVHPCPPDAECLFQTNWGAAKLADLDFTGAVASNETKTSACVVFVYPLLCSHPTRSRRGITRALMEDTDAVWMCETRGEKEWEKVRQASGVTFVDSPLV
ncbi:hypothetical protein MSAN_00150800 [Mycena sanguinolenta]|uniref:Uncharacterized protein n=1 Tax=Mycena sanguinolenta TaxID=230812 RepID=A0A8H7DJ46_9AGAR|nr:hypothetical protein MSAN_00150800 [Mycena sanguinolenta]